MRLKSDSEALRRRGHVSMADVGALATCSAARLRTLLSAGTPVERSASARLLGPSVAGDGALAALLLQCLCREKCLYTRIELCGALALGDRDTAQRMTAYLGMIGSNQHKRLPEAVSQKKGYPLPRDIVARTLAKMDAAVFPALLAPLAGSDEAQIAEALDAVGFMAFHHPALSTLENLSAVLSVLERNGGNALIRWKAVACLSAFRLPQSVDALDRVLQHETRRIIREEAARSNQLILRYKSPSAVPLSGRVKGFLYRAP